MRISKKSHQRYVFPISQVQWYYIVSMTCQPWQKWTQGTWQCPWGRASMQWNIVCFVFSSGEAPVEGDILSVGYLSEWIEE